MKKRFLRKFTSILLAITCAFALCINSSAADDSTDSSKITKNEAIKAALYHVVLLQKADPDSSWKGKKVKASEIVEVYDATDELHSYIINLTIDNEPAGFVEIGNNSEDFPVLSYSFEFSRMNSVDVNNFFTKSKNKNKDKKVKSKKVVIIGPGNFGLKVDYDDNSADIVSIDGITNISDVDNKKKEKVAKQKNSDSKVIWGKIKKIPCGEIGTTTDGVTDSLAFESGYTGRIYGLVSGVADLNQCYSTKWTGPSGCSPTSAYNVFYYWKFTKGKEYLIDTRDDTLLALRTAMGTYFNNVGSATLVENIGPGMVTVAKNRGYSTATQSAHNNPSWSTIKNDIVGPSVITFWNQTYYCPDGAHSVTGVGNIEFFYNNSISSAGHQYLIIHDNWNSNFTPTNVYLAFGRNYDRIHSIKFGI